MVVLVALKLGLATSVQALYCQLIRPLAAIGIVTGHHVHESFVHHDCAGVNQLRWYVLYREPMISHRVVSLALLRGSRLPCETTKSQYEPIPDQSERGTVSGSLHRLSLVHCHVTVDLQGVSEGCRLA